MISVGGASLRIISAAPGDSSAAGGKDRTGSKTLDSPRGSNRSADRLRMDVATAEALGLPGCGASRRWCESDVADRTLVHDHDANAYLDSDLLLRPVTSAAPPEPTELGFGPEQAYPVFVQSDENLGADLLDDLTGRSPPETG